LVANGRFLFEFSLTQEHTTKSPLRSLTYQAMTLDVLDFFAEKGGNPDAIRESQRKRGGSVELVDEVVGMYNAWIKCMSSICCSMFNPIPSDVVGASQ
jgi:hypothetical protein